MQHSTARETYGVWWQVATVVLGLRNGTIDMQSAMDRSPGGSQLPMCKLLNATGTAAEVWVKLADGTMTDPERIGRAASLQLFC